VRNPRNPASVLSVQLNTFDSIADKSKAAAISSVEDLTSALVDAVDSEVSKV
jgi:hypothetical protein